MNPESPESPEHPEPADTPDTIGPKRRHGLALGAVGALAAVAIAAGSFGLGRALAPRGDNTTQAAQSPNVQISGGQDSPGYVYGQDTPWTGRRGWSGSTGALGGTTGSSQTSATSAELSGLVRITTTLGYVGGEAAGTGMVLTSDGEVVTNHHVVAGATKITATVMSTGRSYAATVVGTDSRHDVAVLQLTGASDLATLRTATTPAAVGDKITAVGDANGTANQLMSAAGTVSALNQTITTQAEGTSPGETLNGLIQVSSDVVAGDSGGATYNSAGEVIGMTTAASSGGREVDGFAVPITTVLASVGDLTKGVQASYYSYGAPAFLGIGLGQGTGTTVGEVYSGTAAATAGIVAGDRITRIGSTSVDTQPALQAAIRRLAPGDRVAVTWTGGGTSHTATVTLGSGPIA